MQLRSLEIYGFKSFAERTEFLFDSGITGIVGPNGCGKSNIVDSIRWVLGEQKTRNLRSEKMENIIFNGTSRKKRSGFAQVTLTFDNTKNILPTEYSSVSITRKLYRSGDSDYMINGVSCRLKDIQNLFLDTGVGPDSYAIIELKMVDEILNDKENSRRQLFEEAAGISKYKIRKKQTLKRLKDTQDDLERVEDVLFEIKKQVRSLEKQAKKAKKYFELKQEYKLLSSRHAWFAIRKLRGQYEGVENQEKKYEDQVQGLQSQIAKLEARIQELKKEQLDNEQLLSAAQKDLNEHTTRIREIETEKSIKNERLKYLQQREFAIQDQIESEKKQAERLSDEVRAVEDKQNSLSKDFRVSEDKLKLMKKRLEEMRELFEDQRVQTESMQEEHRLREQELQKLEKDLEIRQIQVEGFENEIRRNEEDKENKSDELDSFAGNLQKLREEIAEEEKIRGDLQAKKEANDLAIENARKEINVLKDEIYRINRGLDARQNEYNLTKSLVENLEGFPESVKYLKKEAEWMREAPLLSDVFYAEESFKVAFENLLEPFLSYYVVDTREDAYRGVKLLADTGKGRANFFVLEDMADYRSREEQQIAGARPALQLVEFKEKYQKLAEMLLDRVYVVERDADMPAEALDELWLINQSGTLLRKKYSLGGGSVGLFQGKRLGRARNLEKLDKEIRKFEKELNQKQTVLDKVEKDLAACLQHNYDKDLQALNQTLQKKIRDLSVLEAREKEYREFIQRAGERSEVIEQKIQTLEEEMQSLRPRLQTLRGERSEKAAILEEAQRMLENSRAELSEQSQEFNQHNISYIQLKNLLENLEREGAEKSERLKKLLENEGKLKKEYDQTKKDIHDLVQNNLQNDEEIVGMYEAKKVKEERTEKFEQIAATIKNSINQVDDNIRTLRKQRDELDTAKNEVRERVTDIKIELNSLKERMSVEFEVDISDLDEEDLFAEGAEQFEESKVEEEMLTMRAKIQKYGEINPMAMEAFDEMKERADFIEEQKKDLEEARQTLLDTIAEIDETATAKFKDSFVQIRDNFKEVFQSLFYEGDTCDLILTDPSDPLESKIDIMAKPKGKRPLTINQLSGGEKTLTAISLLFAIYLLKPAPFCVFDEVDAPLDDANIDKFNNIIKTFSKDSQFIIVTHNKRTMAATNVMYGVTMQQDGVSKVLPVDLVSLNLQE